MASFWDRDDDDDAVLLHGATEEQRDNKDVVLKSIMKYGGDELEHASPRLKDDEDILLAALWSRPDKFYLEQIWKNVSQRLRDLKQDAIDSLGGPFAQASEVSDVYRNLPLFLQYDRDVSLKVVEQEGTLLQELPLGFREMDVEIVMTAISNDSTAFQFVGTFLQQDRDVIATMIVARPEMIQTIYSRVQDDEEMCFSLVERNCGVILHLPPKFQQKKNFVVAAIKGGALDEFPFFIVEDAFKHFLDDNDIATLIVEKAPYLIANDSFECLQNRKHFLLEAIKKDADVFQHLPLHHRADENIALVAINNLPINLGFSELSSDKEVVLLAVSKDGHAVQFASDDLKSDRDVAIAAVSKDGHAIRYLSNNMKSDREIAMAAVTSRGYALQDVSDCMKSDRRVVTTAVANHGFALQHASDSMKSDRQVVMTAVANDGRALQHAPDSMKADRDVVTAAVKHTGVALQFASEEMKANRNVVLAAIARDSARPYHSWNDDGRALSFAAEILRSDPDIVYAAVTANGRALPYASNDLRDNERIVIGAISSFPDALQHASETQRRNMNVLTALPNQCPRPILKYGLCPDEFGVGNMSLKHYIVSILRRIESRGGKHRWVKDLLYAAARNKQTMPVDFRHVLTTVQIDVDLVRRFAMPTFDGPTNKYEPAIKKRILDYTGFELILQDYIELARCGFFFNTVIAAGSYGYLHHLFELTYKNGSDDDDWW